MKIPEQRSLRKIYNLGNNDEETQQTGEEVQKCSTRGE